VGFESGELPGSLQFGSGELCGFLQSVREGSLSNGIRVLFRQRSVSPLVTFQVWYRVGSRNESVGSTGLSHLLEHMMFKGTDKTGPEEFSKIVQAHGGQTNAFTTKDFTAYYEIMASDRIHVAMDLERDRMKGLRLRSKDFLSEKKVVMEERRLRTETQPEAVLLEELEAAAFSSHPYRWPIIGWMEDLQNITLKDLRKYMRTHYVLGNILMVGVGDMEPQKWWDMLEARFGDLPAHKPCFQPQVVEPTQKAERRVVVRREAQVGLMAMGFHVPRLGDEQAPALDVLACLLGGGRSSRLYRRLVREEALALGVDADYRLLSLDPGLFLVMARILPGKSLERAEKLVEEELEKIIGKDQDLEKDLQRAKEQLERNLLLSLDSIMAQALILAQYELCGSWKYISHHLQGIKGVDSDSVSRAAKSYLTPANRTTGWLVPEGGR